MLDADDEIGRKAREAGHKDSIFSTEEDQDASLFEVGCVLPMHEDTMNEFAVGDIDADQKYFHPALNIWVPVSTG